MQCLFNASQLLMVLNSQSECCQRCIATAILKEKITEVFILKLLLTISDLMWQVMRSCFRFDQNTKRVSRLFYCASICLLEHNSTTNHTASITPTYPQEVVITYTIVCSSRQAASNPIGLNLHLDFARLSYILFPLKTYRAILQVLDCASHIYLHMQQSHILPEIRPSTSLTPNASFDFETFYSFASF